MNKRIPAALISLVLLAVACGRDDDASAGPTGPEPMTTLAGTSWVAQAIFVDGNPVEIVPRSRVTLVFGDEGGASGTTGCNGYFADVSFAGDRISFGQMGMTEMACEPPLMEQESMVFAIFAGADRWSLSGGVLNVESADGSGRIEFVEPTVTDADIAGTRWVLDTIIDGTTASTPVVGSDPALRLNPASGEITGSTGCNEINGEVAIALPAFSVENLVWTERGCEPALMDQEAFVLAVLLGADRIGVEGDRLTLSAPNGTALVYRAA